MTPRYVCAILLFFGTIPLERGDLDAYESDVRETLAAAEELGEPMLLAVALRARRAPGRPPRTPRARAPGTGSRLGRRTPARLKGLAHTETCRWRNDGCGRATSRARASCSRPSSVRRAAGETTGLTAGCAQMLVDSRVACRELGRSRASPRGAPAARVRRGQSLARGGRRSGSKGSSRRLAGASKRPGGSRSRPSSVGEEFTGRGSRCCGRWVLGFLALSLDEPTAAFDALGSAFPRRSRSWPGSASPSFWPILPDALEAAVGVGRLDEAEATLATFERQARGAEHRWARPAVLRCRALLLLARGDSEAALTAAEQAASGFEAAGFPLDHGRALPRGRRGAPPPGRAPSCRGEARGVDRRSSPDLGAPLWLARAEKELSRARPRPRSDRELTSAERRVAALVAAGRTNREVSAQLFTTVGTVEVHLTRIYRKLGLRSRTELARRVADGSLDLDDA